ncbi:AMP-binding protein [Alcaligenaceae bacterium]|nr:AMP-binding protein [Alcaligenaceae bacterium]
MNTIHAGPGIGELILHALDRHGEKTALVNPDGAEMTYAGLRDRIQTAMYMLADHGAQRGDCIMHLTTNRSEAFAAVAACYIAGYIVVAPHFSGSLEDQLYILKSCKARLLIVDGAFTARALALNERLDNCLTILSHDTGSGVECLWDYDSPIDRQQFRVISVPDDVVRLIYTGGTTGKPKGVMASSHSIAMNAMLRMAAHDWRGINYLCASPMSHAAGQLIVPVMSQGGTVFFHNGFDEDDVFDALETGKVNALYVVPTMLYKLLDHLRARQTSYDNLRMVMYGASPISPVRLKEARDLLGPVLIQHYGLSEAPSTLLFLDETDHLDDSCLSSAGRPYFGVNICLLDENGCEVMPGDIGEICVRTPLVMVGYWDEPELTAQAMQGGWLHSGDLARRDERGYYFLVDRKKDLIISGGFNVYPKEVEDIIAMHPSVADVAVIGVPDATWGEAVKALVVPRPGQPTDGREIIAYVKRMKGSILAPKSIDFVSRIPTTPLGKPDKKAMRAAYWEDTERNVN